VVAPQALANHVRRELPDLRPENLILEPTPRDTGPAIGLACATVARVDPEAIVGMFPTDHLIRDRAAFVETVRAASHAAARGGLVCLGVHPDRPATGFGYLRCSRRPQKNRVVDVERFVEKPSNSLARRFVKSGNYLWNGGMFVWRVDRFLDELSITAPQIHAAVQSFLDGRKSAWKQAPRLSVDYAVMERARQVKVVKLDAGWDDIGSWDAAARHRKAVKGGDAQEILVDSPGTITFGGKRLIAVVGLPDIVVVDTEDALLVVSRRSPDRVKEVVETLRRRRRKDLL